MKFNQEGWGLQKPLRLLVMNEGRRELPAESGGGDREKILVILRILRGSYFVRKFYHFCDCIHSSIWQSVLRHVQNIFQSQLST